MRRSTRSLGVLVPTTEGNMKTMTCKQLGGACDKQFRANSFDEIAGMSKQHAMDMFQKKDAAHLKP